VSGPWHSARGNSASPAALSGSVPGFENITVVVDGMLKFIAYKPAGQQPE
jgi:hypothetical protein